QAEDGIRGFHVTGVQTCALPISRDRRALRRLRFPARGSRPRPRPRRFRPAGATESAGDADGAGRLFDRRYAESVAARAARAAARSEEHTSELQSRVNLVCRLLLE